MRRGTDVLELQSVSGMLDENFPMLWWSTMYLVRTLDNAIKKISENEEKKNSYLRYMKEL